MLFFFACACACVDIITYVRVQISLLYMRVYGNLLVFFWMVLN